MNPGAFLIGSALPWIIVPAQAKEPAEQSPRGILTVYVGASPQTPSEVLSFFKRELRSIPDVTVTPEENGAMFDLLINAVEAKTVGGQSRGYVISYTIARHLSAHEYLLDPVFACIPEGDRESIEQGLKTYVRILNTVVQTCSKEELKETVETLVADLDTKLFEVVRTLKQHSGAAQKK